MNSYTDAKWFIDPINKQKCAINCLYNGSFLSVPLVEDNTDYQNIMKLVEEGKLVIQPADEE